MNAFRSWISKAFRLKDYMPQETMLVAILV